MDISGIIQKRIDGTLFQYDLELDLIRTPQSDSPPKGGLFQRTLSGDCVDTCIEITRECNFTCRNCFSRSSAGRAGRHASYKSVLNYLRENENRFIRVLLTGGEPFLHPDIESFLDLPQLFSNCGFVINTNGSVASNLDSKLIENNWLCAISLHGTEPSHNRYTSSSSFRSVVATIERLASRMRVHIYSVIHDGMTTDDIDWLVRFRRDSAAGLLRFITPRNFGRYSPLKNTNLSEYALQRLGDREVLKTEESNSRFLSVEGVERKTS